MRSITSALGLLLAASVVVAPLPPAHAAGVVDTAPIAYLVGPDTRLSRGVDLELDRAGNRYVPDLDLHVLNVFAPGLSGNAAPTRSIGGDLTGFGNLFGVAVAPDGTTYVSHIVGMVPTVSVFAAGADGDVAPIRVISGSNTGLHFPQGLALDSTGRLYVANAAADSVTVYAPGADGNIAPLRTISGAATGLDFPVDVVVDTAGVLYVASPDGGRVTAYPSTVQGDVAPIRTLSGTSSTLASPVAVAVDAQRNLYVGDAGPQFGSPGEVAVFGKNADGDVVPDVLLSGPDTDLSGVSGVAVSATNRVQVVTAFSASVLTYRALVPLAPSAVRSLAVAGPNTAARRKVTWQKPRSDGDAAITTYRVVVRKGARALVARTLGPGARKLFVRRDDLRTGRHTVTVRAINAAGAGPSVSKAFTIRR